MTWQTRLSSWFKKLGSLSTPTILEGNYQNYTLYRQIDIPSFNRMFIAWNRYLVYTDIPGNVSTYDILTGVLTATGYSTNLNWQLNYNSILHSYWGFTDTTVAPPHFLVYRRDVQVADLIAGAGEAWGDYAFSSNGRYLAIEYIIPVGDDWIYIYEGGA